MKLSLLKLQEVIYEKLSFGLSYPVYDDVPQGASCPYVTVGEDTGIDWGAKEISGQEVTHTVHVWSQYRGFKECKEIMDSIVQVITGQPLVIDGFYVVVATLDYTGVIRDPDGITRHGIVRFRFKVHG